MRGFVTHSHRLTAAKYGVFVVDILSLAFKVQLLMLRLVNDQEKNNTVVHTSLNYPSKSEWKILVLMEGGSALN
ncbi:hypothetical protein vseg_008610 [Gypsophila vaccaria]